MNVYTELAKRFNDEVVQNTGKWSDAQAQFLVAVEEMGELSEAINEENYESMQEEMADVLVTIFLLAEQMAVNIDQQYAKEMNHNLQKTGVRVGGKVQDDG